MSIFRNKGEEPTAKDSRIDELEATVKKLRQDLTDAYNEQSELLKEIKSLTHDMTMLKLNLSNNAVGEEKKRPNLNLTYDGIQEYQD